MFLRKMIKPTLEVEVSKKTLSIDGKKLSLDDRLTGAGISRILDTPDEIALELNYLKHKFSQKDEGNKIYSFLEQCKLLDKIDVDITLKKDYNTKVFPAVALTGNFNAAVYD